MRERDGRGGVGRVFVRAVGGAGAEMRLGLRWGRPPAEREGGGTGSGGVGDTGKIAYLVFLFTASSQLISLLPASFLPSRPVPSHPSIPPLHHRPWPAIWADDLSIS